MSAVAYDYEDSVLESFAEDGIPAPYGVPSRSSSLCVLLVWQPGDSGGAA